MSFFHALQYGALQSAVTHPDFDDAFNDRSGWLFEGATSALAGRLIFGLGEPHRNDFVADEMPQRHSIWAIEEVTPSDAAQEFFVYLEKSFGGHEFLSTYL